MCGLPKGALINAVPVERVLDKIWTGMVTQMTSLCCDHLEETSKIQGETLIFWLATNQQLSKWGWHSQKTLNLNTEKDGTVAVEGVDEVIGWLSNDMGRPSFRWTQGGDECATILTGRFSWAYQVKILWWHKRPDKHVLLVVPANPFGFSNTYPDHTT